MGRIRNKKAFGRAYPDALEQEIDNQLPSVGIGTPVGLVGLEIVAFSRIFMTVIEYEAGILTAWLLLRHIFDISSAKKALNGVHDETTHQCCIDFTHICIILVVDIEEEGFI